MSRRARVRPDKRATAFALHRSEPVRKPFEFQQPSQCNCSVRGWGLVCERCRRVQS